MNHPKRPAHAASQIKGKIDRDHRLPQRLPGDREAAGRDGGEDDRLLRVARRQRLDERLRGEDLPDAHRVHPDRCTALHPLRDVLRVTAQPHGPSAMRQPPAPERLREVHEPPHQIQQLVDQPHISNQQQLKRAWVPECLGSWVLEYSGTQAPAHSGT